MFGKKPNKPNVDKLRSPVYPAAWSAYAASARFRGVVALMSLVLALVSASSVVFMAATYKPIVVNIDREGRPELVGLTDIKISRELFVKDFLDNAYNYMPMNVEEKAAAALRFMTPNLAKAWNERLGDEWTRLVKANDVLQVVGVRFVEIVEQTENTFTARASVQSVRTERRVGTTSTREGTITVTARTGSLTRENPYGLYVDVLRDETQEVRR